tara:strand:+ start:495 stop:1004 length:510 start_codon:yes stop_codon:yes gene_type:complete
MKVVLTEDQFNRVILKEQKDWTKGLPLENREGTIEWIKRKLFGMMKENFFNYKQIQNTPTYSEWEYPPEYLKDIKGDPATMEMWGEKEPFSTLKIIYPTPQNTFFEVSINNNVPGVTRTRDWVSKFELEVEDPTTDWGKQVLKKNIQGIFRIITNGLSSFEKEIKNLKG